MQQSQKKKKRKLLDRITKEGGRIKANTGCIHNPAVIPAEQGPVGERGKGYDKGNQVRGDEGDRERHDAQKSGRAWTGK